MLYQITNGTVSAGDRQILSQIDFEIKGKEKIAVVGRNGAGKTTLLRLIAGEVDLDRDDKRMQPGIRTSRKLTIGMLYQASALDLDKTVEEILLESCPVGDRFSKERYFYEMEYDRLFTGFGFDKKEKQRKLSSFSGGEQTKISLIRLLLAKPDILLLDEPTNHLDIPTVEWLEQYMKTYEKAVVFVSHDRFFLDQVVDVVYELQNGKMKRYPGNYTNYRQQKWKDLAIAKKAYESQQKEVERLNELIEKFKNKPKKAAFARSRKTILDRMEKMEKPDEDEVHIFMGEIEPEVMGSKWMLEAEHLKIGYDKVLLELSLRIRNGQKIGIIGDNGVGKTTFLKTVAGLLSPLEGKCTLGNRTVLGYFDQQTAAIESDKQVVEHFREKFPAMNERDARQNLAAYLFKGKAASVKAGNLSGGEKSRLVLAELLCSRPNFLLLDEPTNHMDIQAKETLESAFRAYRGTILFVSHDRYFIQQVADAILVFEDDTVKYYPFGYEHYVERKRKSQGQSVAAMVQAEDQALISGIRAVPKGERHQLQEIDTEQAYLDWQLGLLEEPMENAKNQMEILWEKYEKLREEVKMQEWKQWIEMRDGHGCHAENDFREVSEMVRKNVEDMIPEEEKMENPQESSQLLQNVENKLELAWQEWTDSCLEWYDVWED